MAAIDTIEKAEDACAEGIWLAGFACFALIGIEGNIVKSLGYGAITWPNLLIGIGYLAVCFSLWRKWLPGAVLGILLPILHVAFNVTILMMAFDAVVLSFTVNGLRGAQAWHKLKATA